ncbi:MAG: hypothetical protein M3Y58_15930, partial [Chloroflexota bacterium]|nr:hypothetical protein [Chloroflexota bacterium]
VPILLFFTPQDQGRRIALDFTLLGPANTSLMKEQIMIDAPYPRHRAIIAVTLNDVLLAEIGVYRIRFEVGAQKYDGPSFDVEMLTDKLPQSDT